MDVKTREKSLVVSKGNYKSFLELATRGPSPYYDSSLDSSLIFTGVTTA